MAFALQRRVFGSHQVLKGAAAPEETTSSAEVSPAHSLVPRDVNSETAPLAMRPYTPWVTLLWGRNLSSAVPCSWDRQGDRPCGSLGLGQGPSLLERQAGLLAHRSPYSVPFPNPWGSGSSAERPSNTHGGQPG